MTQACRFVFSLLLAFAVVRPASAGPPENLVPPALVEPVTVEYPAALAEEDEPPRGSVVVRFTIGTDGATKDAKVETSLHPDLDALALEAVGRLRYEPASLDGKPVEIITTIAIAFEPPRKEVPEEEVPDGEGEEQEEEEPKETPPKPPPGPVRMQGKVLEAGQRTPIEGATVVVVPAPADADTGKIRKKNYGAQTTPKWEVQTTSAADGGFRLRGLRDGKVRVIILAEGYERFEYIDEVVKNELLEVKYFLTRSSTNPYITVVTAENPREEVARRTITVQEINALPGTQGDALKAIQNFPGVARSPFSIGFIVVRGTGPNDSAIYLGQHEIPQLFHFGGLTSVFNSDIVERIDFIPGNYDARYGDALGGIIDVTPRAGRRDGFHGYIDSDVFDTGILVEAPLGKGSFALAGRRSYIDFLLPVFIPDDAGLDLTLAPRYYDYQALFDYPIGDGVLSIRGFGSDDRTILVAADPNEIETDDRDRFQTTQFFHRADVAYEKKKGPWSFLITPSYRYDQIQLGIGDLLNFSLRTHSLTGRAELGHKIGRRSAIRLGTEYRSTWFSVDVEAPPLPDSNSGTTDDRFRVSVDGFTVIPALYTTLELGLSDDFTLYPGLRAAYYTAPFNTATFDPRLRFGWQVADKTTLKGGTGLYSQAPQPVETNDVFGNPRIGPERSLQNSIGVLQQFPFGISLDATVFFNYLFDNVAPSTAVIVQPDGDVAPENFANTQVGRVYGLEILARKELTSNVFGWIAYTVSRSERRDTPGDDYELFTFDQTHILTIIGVVKLPRNWQAGARFRLVSGNPYTPITGAVYDSTGGYYIAIEGAANSRRFPPFHQLDLRVDKKWIWRRVSLALYLDVQNVYNAQNVEFWNYAYDFSGRVPIASLPIIPSIGTKFEW